MRIFLCIVFGSFLLSFGAILQRIKKLSEPLQITCQNLYFDPNNLQNSHPVAKSLVCGIPLEEAQLLGWFQNWGVVHVLVASGAQILVLHFLLTKLMGLFFNCDEPDLSSLMWLACKLAIYSPLLFYLAVTGFTAPLVRACVLFFVVEIDQVFSWNWNSLQKHITASILTLGLQPAWIQSWSWHLSTLCSLALVWSEWMQFQFKSYEKTGPRTTVFAKVMSSTGCWLLKIILTHSLVLLFILPFSLRWNQWSISSFLGQLTLAPLLSGVLFPVSLMGAVFPTLLDLQDQFVRMLKSLAPNNMLGTNFPLIVPSSSLSSTNLTLWTFILTAVSWFAFKKK